MDDLQTLLNAFALLIHVQGGALSIDQQLFEEFCDISDGYHIAVTPPCAISKKFTFSLVRTIDSPADSVL